MASRRTVELGRMSWKEIDEIRPSNPVVLIPVGSVEQHGPHMPTNGDSMIAEFVAHRAAEATGAYVAPVVNYGASLQFRGFPGTISIQPHTLMCLLRDICGEFVRQGFSRLIFVNNHGGNQQSCEQVGRDLRREHGVVVGSIYPWNLGYSLMRDTYDDPAAAYGHGGEPETSAMLAIFPEDVRLDLMSGPQPIRTGPFTPRKAMSIEVDGQEVGGTAYVSYEEFYPNGVTGDPSVGTAERGKVWQERVVRYAVDFIRTYDRATTA
jgi:creatinine amidohydrolase